MVKRLWATIRRWFDGGPSREELLLRSLERTLETQQKMVESLMSAVTAISATQTKQAEALNTHLSLFKMVEAPTSQTLAGLADDAAWAQDKGFPWDGSPEQQDAWLAAHNDEIYE